MMVFMSDPVLEMEAFRLMGSVSLQEDRVGFNSTIDSAAHVDVCLNSCAMLRLARPRGGM